MNNGNANATNQTTNDVVGWDHTFSANMMNQFRVGFSRFASSEFSTANGISENNISGSPERQYQPLFRIPAASPM